MNDEDLDKHIEIVVEEVEETTITSCYFIFVLWSFVKCCK